jgi:hypothetical protein
MTEVGRRHQYGQYAQQHQGVVHVSEKDAWKYVAVECTINGLKLYF